MIVLKIIGGWVFLGLLFNVVVEGFPDPEAEITRAQRRIFWFDVCMGPIAWIWYIGLKIIKTLK